MTALFVTYVRPHPGREQQALELGIEIAEFWGKLAADGKCTPPQQFLSAATGKVYWIVKGQREELQQVMHSDEGMRLNAKCMLLLEGYTIEMVLADEEVDEMFMTYAGLLPTA